MKTGKHVIPILILSIFLFVAIFHCIGGYAIAIEKEMVVQITAKKFEYSPKDIKVKKNVPLVLEFTSLDRLHGFNCPGLAIRSDIFPGKTTRLRFIPSKAGTYPFHCDNFCGTGHEGMTGTITVED
ncbi:MAG TPA: cytochrome c oxidase subunit II [Syntrophales bacterium]|nr:cytochrome c oxidase subunit II [Syntrophales bacterium]